MIIDSHCHLVGDGWATRSFFVGLAREATAMMGKASGEYPDAEALIDNLMPVLADNTGEKLIASMDAAGVDKTCVFSTDFGLATGDPEVSMEDQNRMIAEAAQRFPDRLIPFFTIDPRRPEGLDLFRRGVEKWGMKGLKFHPTAGFFPYDEVAYPFYEKCMDYGIPVLFHTGSIAAPLKARYARPINVDDVAADFPELPIIMAHISHQLWEEAMLVASVKPNVYVDICNWQFVYTSHPQDFYRTLRAVVDEIGPWRVFWATDGPYANILCPLDTWVKAVAEPDLSSCPDISFTPEEREIIMGKAFAKMMGL